MAIETEGSPIITSDVKDRDVSGGALSGPGGQACPNVSPGDASGPGV